MQPHAWFKTLSFQNCVSEWYFGGVRRLCHQSSYPFLLFCSVFWLLWWENERVPVSSSGMETGGLWWSVLLLQLTHLALCALCVENTQRQPVLGVRCWVLCGTPHCTVLWHWRPGSVFPHQPYWDHPPHSSSCPGIQLGISTPNGSSSLVSQGIQIGAGIASLCGHSVSPQRLRTSHLSFISLPLLGTFWTENVGAFIIVSLQLWTSTVIPRRIPGYFLLFCRAGRRRPSGAPGQGEEELLLRKLRQGKQPLTSTVVNLNDIQIKMYGRILRPRCGFRGWERPPDELQNTYPVLHTQYGWDHFAFAVSYVSLVAHLVKNLPIMQGAEVGSVGWEGPLEKEMATH